MQSCYVGLDIDNLRQAQITLPSSKSLCNRALVISALAGGGKVQNLSDCDDTRAVVNALASSDDVIDIGAAGTAMRFLTAYFAQLEGRKLTLTGSERMLQRPIAVLVDALRSIGADIAYVGKDGFPPLLINGRQLDGGSIEIDASVSSQYISALLMIAPLCKNGLELRFKGVPASLPYIEMTLGVMGSFGVSAEFDYAHNRVSVKSGSYNACDYNVEGDWSAASYWFQICALMPKGYMLRLDTLRQDSLQGDSCVADIFARLGVESRFTEAGVEICRVGDMPAFFEYDFANCPDLAQTLVATCCLGGTAFRFTGLKSLRIKETDRIAALQNECAKLGCVLQLSADDTLEWDGVTAPVQGVPSFDTYEDHRMAMAFAASAIKFGKIEIHKPSVVAKSYPSFWNDLSKLGFTINLMQNQ